MICYNTKRYILFLIIVIFHAGNFHNVLHYILNRINLKEVVNVLRYASESFKAHTGIYIGMRKTRVIVVTVIFELSEYEVPKFDITVALAAYLAVGLAAAVLFAAVIIYFRARPARTRSVLPEVILLAETNHVRRVNAYILSPYIVSLVIFLINADIELFGIHLQYLGAKFPCPRNYLVLKVIAEREVAEHLKIRSVTRGFADIFYIGRSYTLLASCYALTRRRFLARKPLFHGSHTGVYKQKALIVLRYERKARQSQMALAFEKAEVFFS